MAWSAARLGLFLCLIASGAAAEGRCTAPALLNDPALVTKPEAAKPLDPDVYERFYGPRNAGEATGPCADNTVFLFGMGQGEITGALFDQGMAGYAQPLQLSKGKIDKQFARAFAIAPACDPASKVVLVSVDLGLMYHGVRQEALRRLGGRVAYDTLMITATHSHSTAAGQSHHDLYNMSAGGHDAQSFDGLVTGIVEAVNHALDEFDKAEPGEIGFAQAELLNASVQRSREAYDQNPEAERAQWVDVDGNPVTIERNAITVSLRRNGTLEGLMNWFAVHGTSISSANRLLSGDNKGWAALMVEERGPRIAGFFQGTMGDISPNIHMDGLSDSTLRDLDSPEFLARGGGRDDRENTQLSAMRQMKAALRGASSPPEKLTGGVTARHAFIDMRIAHLDSDPAVRTCEPAYGLSAPAGAEDGRGPYGEGWRCSDTSGFTQWLAKAGLWGALTFAFDFDVPDGFFGNTGCRPAREDPDGPYGCHGEKPILAPLGYAVTGSDQPITAPVVAMQIFTIGNFVVIGLPFEVTTMSGRRIKAAVLDALEGEGIDYAVVASHTNGYSHYLTTPEEYDLQLYEGASTIFGEHELDIVIQELVRLSKGGGQSPFAVADYETHVTSFVHEPDLDDPLTDPNLIGRTVSAPDTPAKVDDGPVSFTVYGPNPRSTDLGRSLSVWVARELGDEWITLTQDRSYETELEYDADEGHLTARWYPPVDAAAGTYRLVIEGQTEKGAFKAGSAPFTLVSCP